MVCGRLKTYTLIGIVVIIKFRIVISESVLFVSSFLYIGTIHVHLPNPILSTVVLWLILTMLPSPLLTAQLTVYCPITWSTSKAWLQQDQTFIGYGLF